MATSAVSYDPLSDSIPLVSEFASTENITGFDAVQRDETSFAGSLPANQGLYANENEKDSCGVGFICHVKGDPSHKIVSDARQLLCAMTHRGATGADSRDGDGAGVMTAIPHEFFKREAERDIRCILPEPGEYASGNVFFKTGDPLQLQSFQAVFTKIAVDLGLRVLGWREVPTDGSILGPAARSKEPIILQPFVVLQAHYGDGNVSQGATFDAKHFERQLYVLRKHATHSMFVFSPFVKFAYSLTLLSFSEVRLRKVSMYVLCLPRTLYIRDNSPLRKCTTIIMILIMCCTVPILHWSTRGFQPTLSRAGIVHNR